MAVIEWPQPESRPSEIHPITLIPPRGIHHCLHARRSIVGGAGLADQPDAYATWHSLAVTLGLTRGPAASFI